MEDLILREIILGFLSWADCFANVGTNRKPIPSDLQHHPESCCVVQTASDRGIQQLFRYFPENFLHQFDFNGGRDKDDINAALEQQESAILQLNAD